MNSPAEPKVTSVVRFQYVVNEQVWGQIDVNADYLANLAPAAIDTCIRQATNQLFTRITQQMQMQTKATVIEKKEIILA